MKPDKPRKRAPWGAGEKYTHIGLTRAEYDRLMALGAKLGAGLQIQLRPRQVVMHLLTKAEQEMGEPKC